MKLKNFLFEEDENYQDGNIKDDEVVVSPEPDPIIQMFVDDNLETIKKQQALNELTLFEVVMGNLVPNKSNRVKAGSMGQTKAQEILQKKFPDYKIDSNLEGSNSEDINLTRKSDGTKVCSIEVKNLSSFARQISFFDKTVSKKEPVTGNFLSLIKAILRLKGIKTLKRSVYTAFNDLIKHDQDSLKFAELPEELKKILDKDGNLEYEFETSGIMMRSSHKPFINNTQIPSSQESETPRPVTFIGDTNRIYLQRNDAGRKKFSYIRVQPDKNNNLVPVRTEISWETIHKTGKKRNLPREEGTPGKMSSKYFSLSDKDIQANPNVKKIIAGNIEDAYQKNDYLAIVSGGEIRIISLKNKNPLGFQNIGVFSAQNIENITLRPAGTVDTGKLRVGLGCRINYKGFIKLE